jgi:hypothetical protein
MSVVDLVREVEQAMMQRVRIHKGGATCGNLEREISRLRSDNDRLMDEVNELKAARAVHVAEEEKLTSSQFEAELIEVVKKIQDIDIQLAGCQLQRFGNMRDVGILKKTLSRVQKRDDALTLVDQIEESLNQSKVLDPHGPEATAIDDMLDSLQDEFDRVEPKFEQYQKVMVNVNNAIQDLAPSVRSISLPGDFKEETHETLDNNRFALLGHLQHDLRMIHQLSRLRDIQIDNKQEIGILERAKVKLQRNAKVHALIAGKDSAQINAKVKKYQDDIEHLRGQMKSIESKLEAHGVAALKSITQLRLGAAEFTAESGKQRESLIANIHQEQQWKQRLAILRGEKMQNMRFILMLKAALKS